MPKVLPQGPLHELEDVGFGQRLHLDSGDGPGPVVADGVVAAGLEALLPGLAVDGHAVLHLALDLHRDGLTVAAQLEVPGELVALLPGLAVHQHGPLVVQADQAEEPSVGGEAEVPGLLVVRCLKRAVDGHAEDVRLLEHDGGQLLAVGAGHGLQDHGVLSAQGREVGDGPLFLGPVPVFVCGHRAMAPRGGVAWHPVRCREDAKVMQGCAPGVARCRDLRRKRQDHDLLR